MNDPNIFPHADWLEMAQFLVSLGAVVIAVVWLMVTLGDKREYRGNGAKGIEMKGRLEDAWWKLGGQLALAVGGLASVLMPPPDGALSPFTRQAMIFRACAIVCSVCSICNFSQRLRRRFEMWYHLSHPRKLKGSHDQQVTARSARSSTDSGV